MREGRIIKYMKKRLRISFSISLNTNTQEFAQFASSFRPQITAAQWMELRDVLADIYILCDLANVYDIRARRIAEPLFLRKESRRLYLHDDITTHLESIGDVGELLEVGYRASQQPISLERLCEGIDRMKFKTEELRQKAKNLCEKKEMTLAQSVSL